jgi:hypothetical protein
MKQLNRRVFTFLLSQTLYSQKNAAVQKTFVPDQVYERGDMRFYIHEEDDSRYSIIVHTDRKDVDRVFVTFHSLIGKVGIVDEASMYVGSASDPVQLSLPYLREIRVRLLKTVEQIPFFTA